MFILLDDSEITVQQQKNHGFNPARQLECYDFDSVFSRIHLGKLQSEAFLILVLDLIFQKQINFLLIVAKAGNVCCKLF